MATFNVAKLAAPYVLQTIILIQSIQYIEKMNEGTLTVAGQ